MRGNSSECSRIGCAFASAECDGSPDRWDDLPEAVKAQPWLFSNILTFSAGPRVRISSFDAWVPVADCYGYSVMYRNAFLHHRNEMLPLHLADPLCVFDNR